MSERSYWLDLSNHQGAATPQQVANARARGFSGVIVNLYGPHALQQLATYRSAGFRTGAYIYLNFPGGTYWTGIPLREQVRAFLAKVAGFDLERVWLDCEDEGNTLSPADTVAALRECRAEVLAWGRRVGWYTARFWWAPQTGDAHDFAGDPLWLATNDQVADLAFPEPFGGWDEVAIEQYSWHDYIDASLPEVDANVMREGFDEEEAEMQTRPLDDVQKVRLGAFLEPLVKAHFTDLVDTDPGDGFDIGLADTPTHDVVVLRLPKGTVSA